MAGGKESRFRVEMQDSYRIDGEKIVISPRNGYVFVDLTSGDDRVLIGLRGKRLTKFIKALRHAEALA